METYIDYWSKRGEYGRIRIERMLERKRNRKRSGKRFMCNCCKVVFNHEVPKRMNPYDEDINGIITIERLCDSCHESLLGDI